MLKKINNFFKEKLHVRELNIRKEIQVSLIISIFVFGILSFNSIEIRSFSAKIISENFHSSNFSNSILEKDFIQKIEKIESVGSVKLLNLGDFLEKIKSGNEDEIKNLRNIYGINFPNFGEILDENVVQNGDKINFYFEATVGKGGSIHEFSYEGKILENGKIIEILEN